MDTLWVSIRTAVDRHCRIARAPVELLSLVPHIRTEVQSRTPPADQEPADLDLLILAAIYGPRELGLPPAEVRAQLQLLHTNHPSPVRLIERVLVQGALRAVEQSGWVGRWDRAIHGLSVTLERLIRESIHWIRDRVDTGEWIPQTRDEVRSCARFLAEVLVAGRCSLCAAKWEDLRLQDLATTLTHCSQFHRLAVWDGVSSLDDFLRHAAEHTQSRVGLESRVNDFRRGMLAKVVGAGQLFAGYVLRCACGGEIPISNRCSQCEQSDGCPNPRHWWLWFAGQRRAAGCRECHDCQHYFFPDAGRCPQGHSRWSKRDFLVWVRDSHGSFEGVEATLATANRPDERQLAWAIQERLSGDRLSASVAQGLFLDGKDLPTVTRELGYTHPDAVIVDAAQRVAGLLQDLFPDLDDSEVDP